MKSVNLHYELKQNSRYPIQSIIIFLLLTAITFVFVIESSIYVAGKKELKRAGENYSTIGTSGPSTNVELGGGIFFWGIEENSYIDGLKYVQNIDQRKIVAGVNASYNRKETNTLKNLSCFLHVKAVSIYNKNNSLRVDFEVLNNYTEEFIKVNDRITVGQINLLNSKDIILEEGTEYFIQLRVDGPNKYTEEFTAYADDGEAEAPSFFERLDEYRRNYISYSLVYTNSIESIPAFHSGSMYIKQGTWFEKEHYQKGNVCIVSEEFAALNGLSLGSTISFDVYEGIEFYNRLAYSSINQTHYQKDRLKINDNTLKRDVEYAIVGIYSSRYDEVSKHNAIQYDDSFFGMDTIFVPSISYPRDILSSKFIEGSEQDFSSHRFSEELVISSLYSFTIKTGYEEQFMNELHKTEFPFEYRIVKIDDGGYKNVANVLINMKRNAFQLLALCGVGIIMLLIVTAYFYIGKGKRHYRVMTSIGISKKKLHKTVLMGVSMFSFGGVVLGSVLGGSVARTFIEKAYHELEDKLLGSEFQVIESWKQSSYVFSSAISPVVFLVIPIILIALVMLFTRIGLRIVEGGIND